MKLLAMVATMVMAVVSTSSAITVEEVNYYTTIKPEVIKLAKEVPEILERHYVIHMSIDLNYVEEYLKGSPKVGYLEALEKTLITIYNAKNSDSPLAISNSLFVPVDYNAYDFSGKYPTWEGYTPKDIQEGKMYLTMMLNQATLSLQETWCFSDRIGCSEFGEKEHWVFKLQHRMLETMFIIVDKDGVNKTFVYELP